MLYEVKYAPQANIDLAKLLKDEPRSFRKAIKLLDELKEHPKMGTGHPEQLKGKLADRWSRQITRKHRLVYRICDAEVIVLVLTAYGHYGDK